VPKIFSGILAGEVVDSARGCLALWVNAVATRELRKVTVVVVIWEIGGVRENGR